MAAPLHKSDEFLRDMLKEKDEQIAVLLRALAEKERRCKDLELAVTLLGAGDVDEVLGRVSTVVDRGATSPRPSPAAVDEQPAPRSSPGAASVGPAAPPAPKQPAGAFEVLIMERSTGLYDDNWLSPRSSLAINRAKCGKNVTLLLYLPEIAGGVAKQVRLKPNFSDPFNVEVPRGERFAVTCSVPGIANFTPRINFDMDAEPRNSVDLRDLGVLLVAVQATA